jgi:hypothetical protein
MCREHDPVAIRRPIGFSGNYVRLGEATFSATVRIDDVDGGGR